MTVDVVGFIKPVVEAFSFQEGLNPKCRKWLLSVRPEPAEVANFFYFGLRVPPRRAASLWVTSLGTRIQCGGTLSPLPSGTDSLGIGGDVQWNGLTVLLELVSGPTVASLLNSQLVRLYSRI